MVRARNGKRNPCNLIERLEARTLLAAVGQQPTGALTGKIVYTVGGHGITASYPGTGGWSTQRGENNELVEDFGNQDQMTFYVNYLFNAGATVVPLRPVGHQTSEVVLDNGSAGVTYTGTWSNGSSTPYFGTATDAVRYRSATSSTTQTATAKYTPNITKAGIYPVYAWALDGANRLPDQLYRVTYAGGVNEVKVNHQRVGKGWVYLGSYYFEPGTKGFVEISNKSNTVGTVIADAIRFGNGMGDINRGAGVSGLPREDEAGLYWIMKMAGVGTPTSAYYGSSDDRNSTVTSAPRYAAYMNNSAVGTAEDRVFLSFHTNAGTGTSRGTIGLYNGNNNPDTATPHQQQWAELLAREIRDDLVGLGTKLEFPWANNANLTLDRSDIEFGELNNLNINDEFDATIIEVGYHDNVQDAADMLDPKVRDWIGRATYQASVKYFNQFSGSSSALLPESPTNVRGVADSAGAVTISWTPPAATTIGGQAPTGYMVYTSPNGYGFDGGTKVNGGATTSLKISGLSTSQVHYFRVAAINAGGQSLASEVVAVRPRIGGVKEVLIVNGFDRLDRAGDFQQQAALSPGGALATFSRVRDRFNNTRDYAVLAGEAIEAFGNVPVDSCQNESITSGQIKLTDYKYVIWLSGEEAVKDQTFTAAEQTAVTNYLATNGKMFISGSEIGFELVGNNKGANFYKNTLRANYVADDAASYTAGGVSGSVFQGISLSIDNGTAGGYAVDTPDKISTNGGSTLAMNYTGTGSGGAAIQYSNTTGQRIVLAGFPFESITTSVNRNAVMAAVLRFFGAAPAAPTGLTLAGGNKIRLDWKDNSPTNLAGYNVYRSRTSGGLFEKINTSLVTTSAYTDSTIPGGKTFFYVVTAVDKGGRESARTSQVGGRRSTLMINTGGGAFTDSKGNIWSADTGFAGGTASTTSYAVGNTTDDALYFNRRYGTFSYSIAVPNGDYQLKLYFADPSFTTAGKRKFNVLAEGKEVLSDFDLAASGGGRNAIVRTFNVTIVDGRLSLFFESVLDNAIISGIELI